MCKPILHKASVLILLLGCVTLHSTAQSFYSIRRDRNTIVSAGTGTSTYFGELANPGDYFDAKPNLNIGLQFHLSRRVSLRSEITWFQLTGSDKKADIESDRRSRNLSFQSNNYELNTVGIVSLFPNGQRFYQRSFFNVYGFAGIGLAYVNPKTEFNGEKIALQPLETEGVSYSRFQPVVPYGLGVRIKSGPFFNLCVEGGYRLTFTDYLDDVSTVHKDVALFSDPIASALADRRPEIGESIVAAGTQRGNPDNNDGYFLLNVKLEYYLPFDLSFTSRKKISNNGRGRIKYKKYKSGRRR
jgi:hypothetical protein